MGDKPVGDFTVPLPLNIVSLLCCFREHICILWSSTRNVFEIQTCTHCLCKDTRYCILLNIYHQWVQNGGACASSYSQPAQSTKLKIMYGLKTSKIASRCVSIQIFTSICITHNSYMVGSWPPPFLESSYSYSQGGVARFQGRGEWQVPPINKTLHWDDDNFIQ